MLLHAKFINRAVFPDGRWLQPGEQVDWDQNNNRWSADNEFLDTYLLPRRFLSLQPPLHLLQATVVDFHSAEPGGGRGMRRKEVISLKRAQAGGRGRRLWRAQLSANWGQGGVFPSGTDSGTALGSLKGDDQ